DHRRPRPSGLDGACRRARRFAIIAPLMENKKPEPETPERPRPSLRLRLLFLSVVIIFALIGGELLLRVLARDVELRRRLRAGGLYVPFEPGGVGDHWHPDFQVTYRINALGYRDKERALARQPGRK